MQNESFSGPEGPGHGGKRVSHLFGTALFILGFFLRLFENPLEIGNFIHMLSVLPPLLGLMFCELFFL